MKNSDFSNGHGLKLDKLQMAALALVVAGTLLDLATTEILLSVGSIQVGGTIISFSEANPLFHALGHERFLMVCGVITLAIACLIIVLPNIVPRDTTLYQVALMALACYGIAHLALGLRNYQIWRTYFS